MDEPWHDSFPERSSQAAGTPAVFCFTFDDGFRFRFSLLGFAPKQRIAATSLQ